MSQPQLTPTDLWPHQREDAETLVRQRRLILGWDPGLGKSRAVITALCQMYAQGDVNRAIVVVPPTARSVWADPDPVLGELAKWMPEDFPYTVASYHTRTKLPSPSARLQILVTNPEFIRQPERLEPLIEWARGWNTMLVGDESWQWQNPQAKQTKAMAKLREVCRAGVVLLNGTLGEPKQQYAQFAILGKDILGCKNWFVFRNRFCRMGGYAGKEIVGYQRMDEFHEKTAPFVRVRRIRDHLDIGPEPVRTTITATLTPKTWKIYTAMEKHMVAWLDATTAATAQHAATMSMRLAQITNGFVGGLMYEDNLDLPLDGDGPLTCPAVTREVGTEKLDALVEWLPHNWDRQKLLIFTKFRADVERTAARLRDVFTAHRVCLMYGDQAEADRSEAKRLLAPGGDPAPAIVVANAQSGGAGLNFAAANLCVFLANDYSLKTRIQAEGRVDRPGQTQRVTFADVVAVGPDGERKTIDHAIVGALRAKQSVSDWTLDQWKTLLKGHV